MAQEQDKLASLLFPKGGGAKLVNFKLLRATGGVVQESIVRDEVHSALVQAWVSKSADTRDTFPRSNTTLVDVAKIVERL